MIAKVKSSTGKGEYEVNTMELSCTCPHYMYRLMGTGQICKHIKQVLDNPSNFKDMHAEQISNTDSILEFIEKNNNAVDFVEHYSEKELNKLKLMGQVFEKHGVLTVLK